MGGEEKGTLKASSSPNVGPPSIPVSSFISKSFQPMAEVLIVQNTKLGDNNPSLKRKLSSFSGSFKVNMLQISKPLKEMLCYNSVNSDLLSYIYLEDKELLTSFLDGLVKEQIEDEEAKDCSETEHKIVVRFETENGKVPVTIHWIMISRYKYVIEVISLLPSIRLSREKNFTQRLGKKAEKLESIIQKLKQHKKIFESESIQFKAKLDSLSIFSRALSKSKNILLWKVLPQSEEACFVNSVACSSILKYQSKDLVHRNYFDTMYEDDVEVSKNLLQRECSMRLRRIDRFGKVLWLVAQSYIFDTKNAKKMALILEVTS